MAWTLQNEWNTFDRRTHTQLSARVQGKFFIAINRFVCSSWRIFFFFFVAACCDSCETVYFHFFFFILNVYIWNSEWITHEKKNMIVAYLQCTHSFNSSNMSNSFDSQSRTRTRDSGWFLWMHTDHMDCFISLILSLSLYPSLSLSFSLKIVRELSFGAIYSL